MNFIKKLKLIERIDGMIAKKSTGTPAVLSQKIGVSERTLYNIINVMKQLGAPIYYSSSRMSYCYDGTVSFSFKFTVQEKTENESSDDDSDIQRKESLELLRVDAEPTIRRVFRMPYNYGGTGYNREL